MKTKVCTKCGIDKPLSEYHKRSDQEDGLTLQCKICIAALSKIYREKNKEIIKLRKKVYHEKNREKENKRTMEWAEKNREHKKALDREYHNAHKEKINRRSKQWREDNHEKYLDTLRAWINKNPDYRRSSIERLDDSYIVAILRVATDGYVRDFPRELIELKKAIIIAKRELKQVRI